MFRFVALPFKMRLINTNCNNGSLKGCLAKIAIEYILKKTEKGHIKYENTVHYSFTND